MGRFASAVSVASTLFVSSLVALAASTALFAPLAQAAEAPTAITQAASEVTVPAVTLNASVNPNGAPTEYQFEWGATSAYGSTVPAVAKSAGSGTSAVAVSQAIGEIEAETIYHFRVVASNVFGTTYGEDETFAYFGAWTLESPPSPKPANTSYLSDVACPSAKTCLAVGHSNANEGEGLGEAWNGEEGSQKWSLFDNGSDRSPVDVSCPPSTTVCWAVGTQGASGEVLVERYEYELWEEEASEWRGSPYTVHKPVVPEGATNLHLNAIDCLAEWDCTAVGTYYKGGTYALAEHLTSSGWSIQSTPSLSGAVLDDVSCAASNACMAVGSRTVSGQQVALAERWNGSEWSEAEAPSIEAEYEERWFSAVSCPSSSSCFATGSFWSEEPEEGGPFVASYAGAEVSLSTLPPQNESSTLEDISCASSSSCLAVGHNATGGGTLALAYNGAEWATQSSPTPEGKSGYLAGVSCPEASACTAVGKASNSEETTTLAERIDAEWTLESPPSPKPANTSYLSDVACPSAKTCLAVGHSNANEGEGLGEAWNGEEGSQKWSLFDNGSDRSPVDVSCPPSTTVCWAVGTQGASGEVLVERYEYELWEEEASEWRGSPYTVHKPVVPEGATNLHLNAIDCLAEWDCTAVGTYYKGGTYALAEHLTSSGWSIQSTPSLSGAVLDDVSCAASNACMAVGSRTVSGQQVALAERWNGSEWSEASVPAPDAGSEADWLQAVSCANSSACLAIGSFYNEEEEEEEFSFAASYDGTELSLTPRPSPEEGPTFEDVSCATATSCLAVGHNYTGGHAVAADYNGAEWTTQSSSTPEGKSGYLAGASCPEVLTCTAVGKASNSKETVTLAERLELSPPDATTSAASKVGVEEATLNGTVATNGQPSSYWFQYGTSTAYGSTAPAEAKELSGSNTPVAVSQALSDLPDGTTYHYRLAVRSSAGTAYGEDRQFTTVNLPQTTITSPKPSYTSHEISEIQFESDSPGSTFKCALDEGETPTKSCESPYTLPKHLEPGWHTFVVAAEDSEGVEDPTPAMWTFNPAIYPTLEASSAGKMTSPDEGAKSGSYFALRSQWGEGEDVTSVAYQIKAPTWSAFKSIPSEYLLGPEGEQLGWPLEIEEGATKSPPVSFDLGAFAEAQAEGWGPIEEGLQLRAVFNGAEKQPARAPLSPSPTAASSAAPATRPKKSVPSTSTC